MKIPPVPKELGQIFDFFLQMNGQKFQVERNGNILSTYDGLVNTSSDNTPYIGFQPTVDIQRGDWLINPAGERFYVKDKKTHFVSGKADEIEIFYDTEAQHESSTKQKSSNVYNIGTANNSVFGDYNHLSISYNDSLSDLKATVKNSDSPDKDELLKIVSLLEMIVNNDVPASKGIFSKFSDVMERNSWITGSIMSTILGWLVSHI